MSNPPTDTPRLTRDDVLEELRTLAPMTDYEVAHARADDLLCELIDDDELLDAYDAVGKWYA